MGRATYIILIICFWAESGRAQTMTTSIGSPLNMNSRSAYNSGLTGSDMMLTLASLVSLAWKVTVQASGPFTSGSNSIPLSVFSLKVLSGTPSSASSIGAVTSYFTPGTSAQNIVNANLLSLLQNETLTIGYRYAGGTSFFVPAGTYSTTLTFKYVNALGLVQATSTLVVSIIITYTINIQVNDGNTATMSFASRAAYVTPSPLTQTQAINIFSTKAYAITVEASSDLNNGAGSTIAVNNFTLGAVPDPTATGVSGATVTLSKTSTGTIANSTLATLGQGYDLIFTVLSAQALLGLKPSTYSTTLTITATAP